VFDGFDEIADVKTRQDVIQLIDEGIGRIKSNSKSIQVLITSRPAAFSNAGGFPLEAYPHFELTDITEACTNEYVEKWIKANRMDSRDGNEIKRLVKEKLQISHLRELAKSPMQLAIFLSLLKTNGESLPNKRTALYDSYITLFFNREAEKNQQIRDKRDLIIDIHKYLAWVLHSEAELCKNNGSIALDQLIEKLKSYLEKEGHETDIAEELFHVVEERVCALVSRVQGTYEFEVQPLREYFCAKYLYETAPYSPVGKEKKGTKPERFNAIARDFYWNNVVRFYSGCFDKGELPMLVDELKELQKDPLLKYTNYPRLLTSQLLSDWVFTQHPKFFKDVVKIIIDGINIGSIINQNSRDYGGDEPISLPNECGRVEIIKECFEQLKQFPRNDYVIELIGLIVNNPCGEVLELWKNELHGFSSEQTLQWLEYAYRMRIIHKIEMGILSDIVLQDKNLSLQEKKLQIIIKGNRFDVINNNIELKKIALGGILSGKILISPYRRINDSSMRFLSIFLNWFIIPEIRDQNGSLIDFIHDRFYALNDDTNEDILKLDDGVAKLIKRMFENNEGLLKLNLSEWHGNLEKWDILIENFRDIFGDNWTFYVLATTIAGVKDKNLPSERYSILSDVSVSLCKRTKYACAKNGNLNYWEHQFSHSAELIFVSLVFFTWATPKVVINLCDRLQSIINQFSDDDIKLLSDGLERTATQNRFNKKQYQELIITKQYDSLPFVIKYLISYRFPNEIREDFILGQSNETSSIFNIDIIGSKFSYLIKEYLSDVQNKSKLDEIKKYYKLFSNYDYEYEYQLYIRHHVDNSVIGMPIDIAKEIMGEPTAYPRIIASIAEKSCRLYADKNVKIVGKIAIDNNWFDY
jgi:hypothetical protein